MTEIEYFSLLHPLQCNTQFHTARTKPLTSRRPSCRTSFLGNFFPHSSNFFCRSTPSRSITMNLYLQHHMVGSLHECVWESDSAGGAELQCEEQKVGLVVPVASSLVQTGPPVPRHAQVLQLVRLQPAVNCRRRTTQHVASVSTAAPLQLHCRSTAGPLISQSFQLSFAV